MPEILDLRKNKTAPPAPQGLNVGHPIITDEISGQIRAEDQPVNKRLLLIISVILLVLGSGFVFWTKDFITATFFFLLALVIILIGFKSQKTIVWEAGKHGLTWDVFFYPYRELHSFWIEYQPGHWKELSFRSKKWYHPDIKIPLTKQDPTKIRDYLLSFLPEERHEDTIVEMISRKLGI